MSKTITLLFPTIILFFSFILSPSSEYEIPGLDTYIVSDLVVLSGSSKSQSCPNGYTAASGCGNGMCDLNTKAGGNYIYLCQKKIKYKDLEEGETPVNKIKVVYKNKNCGDLKLIDSDLNAKAGGEYIYICYGSEENEDDPYPIMDVFISITDKNSVPEGYTCLSDDLNKGVWLSSDIFLCYKKNTEVPKYAEYSNIVLDTNAKKIQTIENPNDVIYIDNDNLGGDITQSIVRTISRTIETSYTFNFEQSFNFIAKFSTKEVIPFVYSGKTLFRFEFDENESYGYTHTSSETEEIIYPCEADPGQHLMCKAYTYNYKVTIPYRLNIIYHYYDGTKITQLYQSELNGITGSSIQYSKCCIRGCTDIYNSCSQEEINNYDTISGSCPQNFYDQTNNNYYNYNSAAQSVITDLKVVSSLYKTIECPTGYEIINSGCDTKGCDLNYFAGGNYIYLCQKRDTMIVTYDGSEKPIDSVEILFNSKICNNNLLNLIDINLNEGSGGDSVRLCYGNTNSYLGPIVDFFVYIEEVNFQPDGYLCERDKDLNNGTTKGKTTYLCYTRDYDSYIKKIEEENGKGVDSQKEIVTDLEVIHSKKKEVSCPSGYSLINSGCDSNGCDLNHKAGGEYIYLCQKKLTLKNISPTQKLINSVKIIFDKNNNKNLKLIDVDLNKGAGGKYIYISYGYDSDVSLPPIVDFFVHIQKINSPPDGYECDNTDLNKGAGGSYIYLCYKRDYEIPKEIVINNIELLYNLTKRVGTGLPDKFDEIIVESTSLTKRIEKTVSEEKYLQKYFSYSFSLEVSFSAISLLELGYSMNYTSTTEEEWKETVSKTLSTEIECKAVERKKMMCIPFFTNFREVIPYKAYLTTFDYRGKIMNTGEYYGNFEKVSASQISYKVCCMEGCCTGNSILDAGKPQCSDNKADILCDSIQDCFTPY